ncbi:MAG: riboflavin biosynthesis protein RibF [Pirellulales bacterium]|nr:riboflavin biosynthesis protein RibF [Pirellulales bacterium]
MKTVHGLDDFPDSLRGGAVAIGNFDGAHLGHARLIERLRAMVSRVGGPAVAFTFDPPPTRLLRPDAAPEPLVWLERKIEILAELGVDALVVYPTNKEFLDTEPREFFDRVVRGRLSARAMVEGPNFFFGRNRSGNVDLLRQLCAAAGMPFEVVQPVEVAGRIVSSSRIRRLVSQGEIAAAGKMLGRPYRIRGLVVYGAGRGARLGYPTANLGHVDVLLPGHGIYAARAMVGNIRRPAAVSLGPNPTFGEGGTKVEVHLIGFHEMIYERSIEVDFLDKLREIKRFESAEALIDQMRRDVARSLEIAAGSQ